MTDVDIDLDAFFANMRTQLRHAVAEISAIAAESQEPLAQELASDLKDTLTLDAFDSYMFELLKAFGCSARQVVTDEQASRTVIRQALAAHPSFGWALEVYRDGVDLEEIEEGLATDPAAKAQAVARLQRWLDLDASYS